MMGRNVLAFGHPLVRNQHCVPEAPLSDVPGYKSLGNHMLSCCTNCWFSWQLKVPLPPEEASRNGNGIAFSSVGKGKAPPSPEPPATTSRHPLSTATMCRRGCAGAGGSLSSHTQLPVFASLVSDVRVVLICVCFMKISFVFKHSSC